MSLSREVFWGTHLFNHHGQWERTRLFLYLENYNTPSGYINFTCLKVKMRYFQHLMEGDYSHKGWVTSLHWKQHSRVWMTKKQAKNTRPANKALWSGNSTIPNNLELQYKTKLFTSSTLTFRMVDLLRLSHSKYHPHCLKENGLIIDPPNSSPTEKTVPRTQMIRTHKNIPTLPQVSPTSS